MPAEKQSCDLLMSAHGPEEREYFRLRAEWLRFKNHIFDTNTELPTLAAVLDDIRRLMEERGTLGLIYLDLGGNGRLEALHGWHAYDEVVRGFAMALATLKDGVMGPRDILAVLSVRADKFLLVLGGPGVAPVDRSSVEALSTRIRQHIHDVLPKHLPALPMPIAFHQGHALMYRDPMLRAERCVHRALDAAMFMSLRNRAREEDERAHTLDAIIAGRQVVTLYQPILDLRNLTVLGHEVFTRGPAGSAFEDAETLFLLAERTGRLMEFERLCRHRSLATARSHLRRGHKLFLNTSVGALRDPEVAGSAFLDQVKSQGLDHADVVLEITERVAVSERQTYQAVLRDLKRQGFGIAIDDMGAGYSSLQAVVEIEPEYLKFDISLVRNIDRSLIKRSLLETLVELSEKIGAQVIAEGIEAESEFRTLRDMGVRLGQGRYLSPPTPVPEEGGARP
jgi:EAL domain-containing protein (putative c-di-GMP-specific phosphodiesterase class I)